MLSGNIKKIIAVGFVLLLILGYICIVDDVNRDIQSIKAAAGVYEKCILRCDEQLKELYIAKDEYDKRVADQNKESYNVDYCKDAIRRIDGISKMRELKREAAKRAIERVT